MSRKSLPVSNVDIADYFFFNNNCQYYQLELFNCLHVDVENVKTVKSSPKPHKRNPITQTHKLYKMSLSTLPRVNSQLVSNHDLRLNYF